VKGQRLDGAGLADVETATAGSLEEKGVGSAVINEEWNGIWAVAGAIGTAANVGGLLLPARHHTATTPIDDLPLLLLLLGAADGQQMIAKVKLLIGHDKQLNGIHKVQSAARQYEPSGSMSADAWNETAAPSHFHCHRSHTTRHR
jgi:hypothetical protein